MNDLNLNFQSQQSSGAGQGEGSSSDLDRNLSDPSQAISLFILKSSPGGMKAAEVFLRNRNWIVASSNNIREALAYVAQRQPSFVMIAADHPNKKVRTFPKLLVQAFPVRVIAFSETQSGSAIAALHDMGLEYLLFPPVSGPSIERMILKIKKDGEKKVKEDSHQLHAQNQPTEGAKLVESDFPIMSEDEFRQSFEKARSALQQLISNEPEEGTVENQSSDQVGSADGKGPGSIIQKGMTSNQPASINFQKPSATPLRGAGLINFQDRNRKSSPKGDDQKKAAGGGQSAGSISQETGKSSWDSTHESQGPQQTPILEGTQGSPQQNGGNTQLTPAELSAKKKRMLPRYLREPVEPKGPNSIIYKGTQTALSESVKTNENLSQFDEIENTTNVACITIESPRFSGFLVAALGKDRKIDQDFIELVRTRLFNFLKAHGEMVASEDPALQLKITQVEFEPWAVEQSEFLRKSVHDGQEVAMAFFPSKETKVTLEESISDKMVKIHLDDLKEDTPVEFDLYIFMPENSKYLLYTPSGRAFMKGQKKRLQDKGVTHMHLRKEATRDVKRYKAQNFLNEKIQAFKSTQKK